MTIRRKVKTIRAACGRHRYLIIAGQLPILLSKPHYRTVGDAKSAGKAHSRLLGRVDGGTPAPHPDARPLRRMPVPRQRAPGRSPRQRRHCQRAVPRLLGSAASGASAAGGGGVAMGTAPTIAMPAEPIEDGDFVLYEPNRNSPPNCQICDEVSEWLVAYKDYEDGFVFPQSGTAYIFSCGDCYDTHRWKDDGVA